MIDPLSGREPGLFCRTNAQRSQLGTLPKPQDCGRDGIIEPDTRTRASATPTFKKAWYKSRSSLHWPCVAGEAKDTQHANRIDHTEYSMCKREQVLLYQNCRPMSQDTPSNISMTFVILFVFDLLTRVQLARLNGGCCVDFCATSEKDAPVRAANSSHLPVDEWKR